MTDHVVATADEVHFASTADGWRLALHRHRPSIGGGGVPVLLCAGYGCNRYFLDFDESYSLARYLAAEGFDAWLVEVRGRGLSHPTRACRRPGMWNFDHLAAIDAPTAIRYVAAATGRQVAWIGHSMGGLLLYACLGRDPALAATVRAGVTIASPVVFPPASSTLLNQIGQALLHVPFSDMVPQRIFLGALWHLVGSSALAIGMNPENIDRPAVGRALRMALSNVSRFKLQQLSAWALGGCFASADGTLDYRAALAGIRTRLLVVAGSGDQLATPGSVRRALDTLPHGTATYLEFGRAHGHAVDYGHIDLVLGRRAPAEVFPILGRWLAEAVAA